MGDLNIRGIVEEAKEHAEFISGRKAKEKKAAGAVVKSKAKRKVTSFSLPPEHNELLRILSQIDNVSKSESLVNMIEFFAKLLPYREQLETVILQKPYLDNWQNALLFSITEYFGIYQTIQQFQNTLSQAVQSITLAGENMLKLTTLQEYIKIISAKLDKQVETAQASIRTMTEFTDQFGIKKGILSLKKDVEKLDISIRSIRSLPVTTGSPMGQVRQQMALGAVNTGGAQPLLGRDESLDDAPDDLFDMI